MNIIIGRQRAEELKEKYTVLELDTIEHQDGMLIEAFCVIPAEKIPLTEVPTLKQWTDLHENLVREYRKGNREFCEQSIEHLLGKFGGEVDSFYEHIIASVGKEVPGNQ